jgi:hypothetical protein
MPYASGDNPKAGDVVKEESGRMGTVFELDSRTDETANEEKIRVKFDDGASAVALASKFELVKRVSE